MTGSVGVKADMKSSEPLVEMTIGEIARLYDLQTHVLRHWEAEGLIAPQRDSAGHRRFQIADRYRVAAIIRAKQAGLSLDDIRALLSAGDASSRSAVLSQRRDELLERIGRAQAAVELIETALSCRHGDIAICPNFRGYLVRAADTPS